MGCGYTIATPTQLPLLVRQLQAQFPPPLLQIQVIPRLVLARLRPVQVLLQPAH